MSTRRMNFARHLQYITDDLEVLIDKMVAMDEMLDEIPSKEVPLPTVIEKPTTESFQRSGKEYYKKIVTDWEKHYGFVSNGDAKLLRDRKLKTTFTYTNDLNAVQRYVSDSDILSHGLHLFISERYKRIEGDPLEILQVIQSMCLSVGDRETIEEWLQRQKNTTKFHIHNCEKLKNKVKCLLVKKKRLKALNKEFNLILNKLIQELNKHSTQEELSSMYQEIKKLKNDVCELNYKHTDILTEKENLLNAIKKEIEDFRDSDLELSDKIINLKKDNTLLQELANNLSKDTNCTIQFRKLEENLKINSKLKNLVARFNQILQERNDHLLLLGDESMAETSPLETIKTRILAVKNVILNLQPKLEDLVARALELQNKVHQIKLEMEELWKKFNTASEQLFTNTNLEEEKNREESEFKCLMDDLKKVIKEVEDLDGSIECFQSEVMGYVMPEASSRWEDDSMETNCLTLIWSTEVTQLLDSIEDMQNIARNAREHQLDEKNFILDYLETIGGVEDEGKEKYTMHGTIVSKDMTDPIAPKMTGSDFMSKNIFEISEEELEDQEASRLVSAEDDDELLKYLIEDFNIDDVEASSRED